LKKNQDGTYDREFHFVANYLMKQIG